jgi:predicted DNA-binding protein (UPF0251 family)
MTWTQTPCPPAAVYTADSPEAQAEQAALARAIDLALARIRPEYREAVVLCYREELSVEQVAEIMSLPSGTVKTYLFRARKELAQILSAQGWSKISASSAWNQSKENSVKKVGRQKRLWAQRDQHRGQTKAIGFRPKAALGSIAGNCATRRASMISASSSWPLCSVDRAVQAAWRTRTHRRRVRVALVTAVALIATVGIAAVYALAPFAMGLIVSGAVARVDVVFR